MKTRNKHQQNEISNDSRGNLEIEDGREKKGTDKFKYLGLIKARHLRRRNQESSRTPEIPSNNLI